ncbi:MAG: HD domain-containing protein [bacterium]|nr:HD domain-containing protein [bacterium]
MDFDLQIEVATRLLVKYIPEESTRKKHIIPHALRVFFSLKRLGYSQDVQLAGLLHDIIEWSDVSPDKIKDEFGERVLEIVRANTKDVAIENSSERRLDTVARCAQIGLDGLAVKAADILDSYAHYTQREDEAELARCIDLGVMVLSHITNNERDGIFLELQAIT